MLAGQIEIQLLANIARLSKDMNEAKRTVGGAMDSIEKSVDRAKMAFGGLAGMLGARELIRMTDEYTKFTAQLRLATTGISEYAIAYANVKRISKDAQAELGATGILYARISNGTRELGISQGRVTDITETVSLALKASGATAQESASAMLQLSQAFGSGVLRGQEFNAVNEAAPRLMKALADGIGVPVGQLRAMAEAGKLTSAVMAEALPKALKDLRKEAASVQTISGAFTVLKNNVMEFVGMQAHASGAVSVLTSGIGMLAENLRLMAAAVAGLAAMKFAQWVIAIGTAIHAKTAATVASIAAMQAERTATITATTAEVARIESTIAFIVAERAKIVAQLHAAQATMASSAAIGAYSAALAANAAATVAASTAMAELAALGKLQTATAAQLTVAQTALATATTATGAAATVASRALAFLGGPIGVITTLLGLGAAAWVMWGRSSEDANKQALASTEASGIEILANLEKQNAKLRERLALAKAGNVDAAKTGGADVDKLASTLKKINDLKAKGAEITNVEQITLIELQGLYDDISKELGTKKSLNLELGEIGSKSKLDAWLAKNKTFLTDTEKLALAIKEAKDDLGDAFNSDVENRIRAQFSKKGDKAANKELEEQAKLLAELSGLSGSFAEDWARLSVVHAAGKISTEQLTQAQAELLEKQPAIKKMLDEEAAALKAVDKANIEASQAHEKYVASLEEGLEKLRKEVEKQREHNDHLGLTKEAIAALDAAKLEEQATTLDGIAIKRLDRDLDEGVYKLYKDQAEELRKLARLKREGGAKEDSLEKEKKALEEAQKILDNLHENIQRNLGDELFNMLDGNFDNIGKSFMRMLLRMQADALAADITGAIFNRAPKGGGSAALWGAIGNSLMGLFGGGGGYQGAAGADGLGSVADFMAMDAAASFDGGGFTGNGPRSGGMDGKGGFLAMMHPQETVVDHTKGQSGGGGKVINFSPTYNIQIDSRSDRAQIMKDMMRLKEATKAELMEEMDR